MKKITFFLTILTICCLFSPAYADSYNYTPYIGVDYTYNLSNAKGYKPQYNTAGIHIGSDYSEYFSTELFYNQSSSTKKRPNNTVIKTSYRSYGLDLLAYLPLGCEKRFSLLATTGLAEYIFNTKAYPAKHQNEHGYGYRFGGGFKYSINNHWQVRFITRYTNYNRVYGYDHSLEYSLGAEYHF